MAKKGFFGKQKSFGQKNGKEKHFGWKKILTQSFFSTLKIFYSKNFLDKKIFRPKTKKFLDRKIFSNENSKLTYFSTIIQGTSLAGSATLEDTSSARLTFHLLRLSYQMFGHRL